MLSCEFCEKKDFAKKLQGSKWYNDILYKPDLQKNWTFRKSGPRTYRKREPNAKIHCIGQKHLYDKLEVADFKYDNNFLNLKRKITQTRHFWFQVWKFLLCIKHCLMTYSRVLNMPAYAWNITCLYEPEFQIYLSLPI